MEKEVFEKLEDIISSFIEICSINLPIDVYNRLEEIAKDEDDKKAKEMYKCMFENLKLAKSLKRPPCQDSGYFQFLIRVGANFKYLNYIEDAVINSVKKETEKIPLRPNVIEYSSGKNTNNNIGKDAPHIEWELVKDSDLLEINLYEAGGGCSLPSFSKVLMPAEGLDAMKQSIYDMILNYGINACPPLIVGVGLSTCASTAGNLSKRALFERIDTVNEDEFSRGLEEELEENINKIGIAPLGFGGKRSVLKVRVNAGSHHPATLAYGVSLSCFSTRRGKLIIDNDLNYKIPTHEVSF